MGAPGGRNHPQTQDILMTTDDAAIALKWFLVSFGQRLCFDQWSVVSFDIGPIIKGICQNYWFFQLFNFAALNEKLFIYFILTCGVFFPLFLPNMIYILCMTSIFFKGSPPFQKNFSFGSIDPNVGGWGGLVPNFDKSLLLSQVGMLYCGATSQLFFMAYIWPFLWHISDPFFVENFRSIHGKLPKSPKGPGVRSPC